MFKKSASVLALTLLTLVVGACATTGESARTNYNVITNEEMNALTTATTLYEVVERLRPRWLTVRAPRNLSGAGEIVVYQDQAHLGGVEILRQFSREVVYSLRYLDGATASASLPGLGGRHVAGAIILLTAPDR